MCNEVEVVVGVDDPDVVVKGRGRDEQIGNRSPMPQAAVVSEVALEVLGGEDQIRGRTEHVEIRPQDGF